MSRDNMLRSTSPAGSTHLTKTGRVSKAAKGMPVHHCHCGKTYTRAEHLRRHQRTHKPGTFSCDVDGCQRAFSREDLLIRHKANHHGSPKSSSETLMSYAPQAQPELHGVSSPSPHHNASVVEVAQPNAISEPHRSSLSSTASVRKGYLPIAELRPPDVILDDGAPWFGLPGQSDWHDDSQLLHHSGDEFQAAEYMPGQIDQFSLTLDTDQTYMIGNMNLEASRSPASAKSVIPTSFWRGSSPNSMHPYTPASDNSLCVSRSGGEISRNVSFAQISRTETESLPEYRDLLEQDELVTPTSVPQNFGARQYHHRVDNQQRYLDSYWHSVHPIWPIIHRPTFDISYTSPLLRSAMLTLGACHIGHQIDSANACILHKRCLKVIKNRSINNSHSYRICDMQAILLVELFSTYKSRRPFLQLSRPFQDNYCTLASDCGTDTASAFFAGYDALSFPQVLPSVTLERESKQRLLAAHYMLDQEQASLFGRHATDVPDFIPANLSLPQPAHVWDLDIAYGPGTYDHVEGWHYESRGILSQAVATSSHLGTSAIEPFDHFVASIAHIYTTCGRRNASPEPQNLVPDLGLHAPSISPAHIELARRTLSLCNMTPVRALLATAGESWVMAEKLSLPAEYTAAQRTVRAWSSTSANNALANALEIIRLHRLHPRTMCFYHEWSLHLASLVVWACTYARRPPNRTLRLSIPPSTTPETVVQVGEFDRALANLADVGTEGSITWEDTKRVLSWAKTRMEKSGVARFCGVVSGAVDVLNVLGVRGEEDGWF